MSRGVLMYAYNNPEIDYFKIACANALMVQRNLQVPVTLVTNDGSLHWAETSLGSDFINKCFEKIITTEDNYIFDNKRTYSDTSFSSKSLQFYNADHWQAYELSPYDETLFIDADYLIMSSVLNNCWGSENDIMLDHRILNPGYAKDPSSKYIDEFGIRQYWATVIYFKKTDFAKFVFEIVKNIQDNYQYYKQLYYFSNGMFRNDYAFSIAIHMLNGFSDTNSAINELPITCLLMSWDTHDIHAIHGINDITLYAEKEIKGSYILTRLKDQDVHIMNKWAINRHADRLIELYKDAV